MNVRGGRHVLADVLATAKRMGSAPAVKCGESELSYAQLVACALHNANRLACAGAGRGGLVLCGLSTGVELAVAWLATMLTHAVLVPFDLHWPPVRLAAVLDTTRTTLAIVPSKEPRSSLLLEHGVHGFEIALDATDTNAWPEGQATDFDSGELLYGFFTSGSTGVPKCALNYHEGLANRFAYMTRRFGVGHRVYQNSAPLFDSSIWQLLWPLTSEGVCILPDRREHWSPDAVAGVVERESISMTDFVPTLFKAMVRSMEQDAVAPHRLRSLRFVLIGGEAIDPVSVHSFRRMLPNVRIINTYGYTEASIGMVFHEVKDDDGAAIPLGSPIDHTYVRIVDESMACVPPGDIGEIVAGGVCIGNGYLNAAALTAKVFVPNPFVDVPGQVVYRSGDLGRFRGDGLLEFLGRIDDQVKVRGVRIELAEVNSAVHQAFPSIEDVCPVLVANAAGEQCLAVAYTARQAVTSSLLRQRLLDVLPASHVPQFFVHLPRMPTGSNGKTQRNEVVRQVTEALQRPAPVEGGARSLMEIVTQCYREVLGVHDVDGRSHFLDYGGDSLSAVHLSLALQSRLGRPVTAGQVYRYPTPQSLHDALTGSLSGGTPLPGLPAVQFHNDGEPRTCSQTVLLTGATGFIGIHLMERLLDRAGIHLVALVRRKGTDTPQARLERVFAEAFPGRGFDGSRVTVLCGDLACPSLGLSAPTWAHIAATVDEIVHCGADVNFLGSPSTLFDANVAGTAELIRLCDEGVPKRLHQISTLAVQRVGAHGDGRQQSVDRSCATGYEYTKHLADELVQRARDQGLRARTYRLDDVLPALETGYPNRHSLIHLFIKACMRHAVVVTGGGMVGLLPVDALAEWICSFVGSADAFSPTPHSMDVSAMRHVALEEIVRFVAGKLGRDVCVIDPASFLQCLACDEDRDAVLLRSMLVDAGGSKGPFAPSTAAPATGCGSVLDSAQWRRRFAIELEDFSSFVRYVEPRAVEHVGQTTLA